MLVDMLLELDSETYSKHVVFENGKKVIHIDVLRAIYGILLTQILFYKTFSGDSENIGSEFNPYDPFIANRIKVGKKNTVRLNVGHFMYIHLITKVSDKFK